METSDFDVVILGAGPAGCALALALARKARDPARIALLGSPRSPAPPPGAGLAASTGVDPRCLALNHGSRVFLETLGAWPQQAADIRQVHVSQRGRLGRVVIDHHDLNVPRLGNVVRYDDLLDTLHKALENSGVQRLEGRAVPRLSGHRVECRYGDRVVSARLAVQSDGARPAGVERQYGQNAVLTNVRASRPQPGWAYERFTRSGPLAALPHPQASDVYSIVWCCSPEQSETLRGLPREEFDRRLQAQFGDRLGTLQSVTRVSVFPLALHAGPSRINSRCIAIGNAAQTLHPVAGQGLNLGLRDVAQLAQALSPWLLRPDSDPEPYSAEFTGRRRFDRWLTIAITDLLPRVFSTRSPLVEHAGGAALFAMDLVPALRNQLARQLLEGMRS
ncbi:MAG TPA: FAD-dependent monooxygenase [Burkholderiaceae bacterium]|nr:FAD-dependent monooxygenase [Burkholderiaceae bacterium]